MDVIREPEWITVGLGLAAFLLTLSQITKAEAKRTLDVHFLHTEAMNLRNAYAQSILALQTRKGEDAKSLAQSPSPEHENEPAQAA